LSDVLVKVGLTTEIGEGEARVFEVEDISVAVCNVAGKFYAIENVCSHDNGPLGEGKLYGCEIECPRHGARFDVTSGAMTRMPAYGPVQTFPVTVNNGEIFVEISD
jgi:3-phenylpropionate/trans-cinnamate dioxygenase ferredoxin subunit